MIPQILKDYNIFAKKSLGQNFLIDDEKIQNIADILEIAGKDILEIGPGYGALTEKLLQKKPQSLYLVELDSSMLDILRQREQLGELSTVGVDFQVFCQDILEFVPNFQNYCVIANIPYYITSPILRHFLYDIQNTPESMVLMMQQDVAEKILGGKKNKTSVLRLLVEKKSRVTEKLFVPKESFFPVPKIESSVLLFETHELYTDIDDVVFLKLIKIGFAEPRKKLIKNLIKGGYDGQRVSVFLTEKGYDENFRGEDGSIEFWTELWTILCK